MTTPTAQMKLLRHKVAHGHVSSSKQRCQGQQGASASLGWQGARGSSVSRIKLKSKKKRKEIKNIKNWTKGIVWESFDSWRSNNSFTLKHRQIATPFFIRRAFNVNPNHRLKLELVRHQKREKCSRRFFGDASGLPLWEKKIFTSVSLWFKISPFAASE